MIARTVKLYPTREQEAQLIEWWSIGTGVWNWALGQLLHTEREIPQRRAYFAGLCRSTRGHALRTGFNTNALQGILKDVCMAWDAYRRGTRGRPHWKGQRNRLASIPFRGSVKRDGRMVSIPTLGWVRTRGQDGLPDAPIKTCRLHRRARGWYFTLVLDTDPDPLPVRGEAPVGVDLGYSTLATLSTGEKIGHPNEYRRLEQRIGQAARGQNRRLLGRLQQSLTLARRTRNHQISRDLVERFGAIYVSRDNIKALQRTRGKSVLNAAHYQLLQMIATKSRQAGRVFLEVPNNNSTRTCSGCGALTGPTGLRGLSVREWACACGAIHDRDVNAAVNTLELGAVLALESAREGTSEISVHS